MNARSIMLCRDVTTYRWRPSECRPWHDAEFDGRSGSASLKRLKLQFKNTTTKRG